MKKKITSPKVPLGDSVNKPVHYNMGKIEVIEFIEDQPNLDYHLGNTVKYICRAGHKNAGLVCAVKDLEKAAWYLNRKLELLRAENEGREPLRPNDNQIVRRK